MTGNEPVIAEIYPKACYGIALAESLPAPLRRIAKTKEHARRDAIEALRNSQWLARQRLKITNFDAAMANEDDFDALLSAAALTRMFLEKAPFESPETVDDVAEGSVLGAASLTTKAQVAMRIEGYSGKGSEATGYYPEKRPQHILTKLIFPECKCP
jgi:hypothetical protein